MSAEETVQKWIEVARWSPSADNTQPWRVTWAAPDPQTITLVLRKTPLGAGSTPIENELQQLALGSLLTSITLVASEDGYVVHQRAASDDGLTLQLKMSTVKTEGWSELLRRRHTNRRPLNRLPLSPEQLEFVGQVCAEHQGLSLIDFSSQKKKAARLVACLDLIRYQSRQHLDHLLKVLRFEAKAVDGLDVKSLDIPLAAIALFWLLNRWRTLRVIFFLGLEKIFAFVGCRWLIQQSGHFYLLRAQDSSLSSWLEVGRCLQKIWLEATRRNLGLQPFGHTFITYEAHKNPEQFSRDHLELIGQVQEELLRLHPSAQLSTAGIFFRLGKPHKQPVVRSKRRSVAELLAP